MRISDYCMFLRIGAYKQGERTIYAHIAGYLNSARQSQKSRKVRITVAKWSQKIEPKMPEKQRNERKPTRYPGVYQRTSRTRRHMGKPDTCFTIDYRDATGARIRKTVGWRSEGFSAEYANALRSSLTAEGKKAQFEGIMPVDASNIPTFTQAWALYRDDWLRGKSGPKAVVQAESFYAHTHPINHKRLNTITAHDIQQIANAIQMKGLTPQTAKHVLAFIRRVMLKMIVWKKWNGPSPFGEVQMPKVNNQRQRYLTPYEAKAILEALRPINERMWFFSLISLHCGLRFREITSLCRGDLDFHTRTIHIRDPKNGADRFAMMTDSVLSALNDMKAGGPPSSLLFPTRGGGIVQEKYRAFDDVIDAFEMNAGVTETKQRIVFHTLRHTYASWLARAGSGQATIADLLGHATLQMSKRYTHLMPDTRREAASTIDALFSGAEHQEPHSS